MVGRTERREAARCVIRSNVAVVCEESNRRLCAVNIDNVEDQSAVSALKLEVSIRERRATGS